MGYGMGYGVSARNLGAPAAASTAAVVVVALLVAGCGGGGSENTGGVPGPTPSPSPSPSASPSPAPVAEVRPAASPDGRFVAYVAAKPTSGGGAGYDLWVRNADGTGRRLLIDTGAQPGANIGTVVWSAGAEWIATRRSVTNRNSYLTAVRPDASEARDLVAFSSDAVGGAGYPFEGPPTPRSFSADLQTVFFVAAAAAPGGTRPVEFRVGIDGNGLARLE